MKIVYPGRWPLGASRLWGRDPRRAAVQYAGAVALMGLFLGMAWPLIRGVVVTWPAILSTNTDPPVWILLVLVVLWAITAAGAAVQLMRVLPDVVSRSTVEGKVIERRFVEGIDGGEGPSVPDTCWIAIDDGRGDSVPAYKVSGKVFADLEAGDHVRLTVGPRHGYVFKVDILSRRGAGFSASPSR